MVKRPLSRASRGLSPEVERRRRRRFGTGASRNNNGDPNPVKGKESSMKPLVTAAMEEKG